LSPGDGLRLPDRALQAILLVAAFAAVAILVNLFGDAIRIACLVLIVVAAVLTAPARRVAGNGWWTLLALGALASVAGALIALASETIGGLVAVVGGVLVVVGATIGFPLRELEEE
jgi:hypothetical protein